MSRTSAAIGLPLAAVSALVVTTPGSEVFQGFTSGWKWQDGLSFGLQLVSFLAIAIYVLVKFEIIVLVSVQEGTVAIRTSWGKPRFYNRDHKPGKDGHRRDKGRLLVLHPGRHLMVKGLHGLVIVNLREEVLEMPTREITFLRRTLHLKGLTFTWRTVYEDSIEGDLRLINRVWFVADSDVHDQSIKRYVHKLQAVLEQAMGDALPRTEATKAGFPDFKVADIISLAQQAVDESKAQLIHGELRKFILPEIPAMYMPPLAWTEAQIEKDAKIRAAKILAGYPDDEAVELPEPQSQPHLRIAGEADAVGIT